MPRIITIATFFLVAILSACSRARDDAPTAAAQTSSAGVQPEPATAVDERPPLKSYADARDLSDFPEGGRGTWIEYWMLANTAWGDDEEKILSLTSERYVRTKDAFARREFREEELARARATLARFAGERHIVVRFGRNSRFPANQFMQIKASDSGAYNFDTKSFSTTWWCGDRPNFGLYFAGYYGGGEPVGFSFGLTAAADSQTVCKFRVEDVQLAKRIESLRARNGIELGGDMYLDLDLATIGPDVSPHMKVTVRDIRYDVFEKRSGEKIVSVNP